MCKVEGQDFGNKENAAKKSPYEDKDFETRLEVEELWIVLTEEEKCLLHNIPFKTIQVMTKFSGTKKYGALLTCCPECKQIYMKRQEFKEYLPIFMKKGIIYHIEEESRKNEN